MELIARRRDELLERSLPRELPPLLGIPRGLLNWGWREKDRVVRVVVGVSSGDTRSLDFRIGGCRPCPRPRRREMVAGAVEGLVSVVVRNVRNRLGMMEERGARDLLRDQAAEGMGVYHAWLSEALRCRREVRGSRVSQLLLQLQADRNTFDSVPDIGVVDEGADRAEWGLGGDCDVVYPLTGVFPAEADDAGGNVGDMEVGSEWIEDELPPLAVGWSKKREWLDPVYWQGTTSSWCDLEALKEYAMTMGCGWMRDLGEKELILKALAHASAMDAMMKLVKVEMRVVPVVPFAAGGGGGVSEVALAASVGSEVSGGARKRRTVATGSDGGGAVRRTKRTLAGRGALLSADAGAVADVEAGGGSAMVAEVPEELVLPETSVDEDVRSSGIGVADSAIVASVVTATGGGVTRKGEAVAKRVTVEDRAEDAEVVEVCDSEDEEKVEKDWEFPPDDELVTIDWEAKQPLVLPAPVVSAMQDRARLDLLLDLRLGGAPDLLLSWLWFRRHILAYPERCAPSEVYCHRWVEKPDSAKVWEVRELEYPLLLRGLPLDHEYVVDFDIQIRWFRDLVLRSEVFQLKRHLGSAGIGLIAREDCSYAEVRNAVVGFAWEIDLKMFDGLRRLGYTALYQSGKRGYIMYGPLALCNGDGDRAPRFGQVQADVDWRESAKSASSARRGKVSIDVGGLDGGMRVLRMASEKGMKDGGEQSRVKARWEAGEDILLRYSWRK